MLELAIEKARKTMNKNIGGPFGAVITDKNNNVICVTSNTVLKDKDPTAHAEMNAIRKACKKLKTKDLSEYILYTTAYPCPMCLSAILWANIKTVYYGTNLNDCNEIGFRDDFIYKFIEHKNRDTLSIKQLNRNDCLKLFKEYKEKNKEIY